MRTQKLGGSELMVPVVAVGCMRIDGMERGAASRLIGTALEHGANFFDHADIYGAGRSEEVFADAVGMTPSVREGLILQSKCGIRPDLQTFDFSREHILASVDGILKRLRTEYLDVLLLHRPDALVEPEEVAAAFDQLEQEGKVRHFGVSNQHPRQIELLKKYVRQPLVANQLQLSITNATMITSGLNVNMENAEAVNRDGGVLDYCRLHDITVQPWSPFQFGFFEGVFIGHAKFPALNAKLDELAAKYGVSSTTVAMAWLLRHPARMQPVTGTTTPERLADCLRAADVTLTREEWYGLLIAAGNTLP
ncbi:aldo/keto reductase [Deinococcus grandis]|uniref:Aldo/keto reductase n=1 Tax=Deinococcus grandis TaxID=57498 RepID=A0A100HJN8_9DEIO|nr:aldo/keto reductase [Deinococcus grandis]GAQ20629.1 aldo/keto reductase [Deinococcus grandis]